MYTNREQEQLEAAASFVSQRLASEGTGHDILHVERVRHQAVAIAQKEGGSLFIIEMSAIVHDVIDKKLEDDIRLLPQQLHERLLLWGVTKTQAFYIMDIVTTMSFRDRHLVTRPMTLEGMIVQDADRLDAMGAIGIARVFLYAGATNEPIYATGHRQGSVFSHMEEKLLKLKDVMNTKSGIQLAKERHQFMCLFIRKLKDECGHTD
ncbi:HD domain-containing protein [Bacillus sp. NPDC077027]|uniref:HD domain-containing protein n=1 Tax=Bacillus sp. NPDC077027 TaxID=3390548 RepID=UPI003D036ADE